MYCSIPLFKAWCWRAGGNIPTWQGTKLKLLEFISNDFLANSFINEKSGNDVAYFMAEPDAFTEWAPKKLANLAGSYSLFSLKAIWDRSDRKGEWKFGKVRKLKNLYSLEKVLMELYWVESRGNLPCSHKILSSLQNMNNTKLITWAYK